VIAGMLPAPRHAIDPARGQAAGNRRAQQQAIDPQPGIAGERVPEIFPEGVDPLVRMERAQCIGPALPGQPAKGFAHFRPEQRVVDPTLRRVHVELRLVVPLPDWLIAAAVAAHERAVSAACSVGSITRDGKCHFVFEVEDIFERGMRGFDAVQWLITDYSRAIDIEICVFPQDGLTNYPGTDKLLVEGLERGAKVIGGAPRHDTDPVGQIRPVPRRKASVKKLSAAAAFKRHRAVRHSEPEEERQ